MRSLVAILALLSPAVGAAPVHQPGATAATNACVGWVDPGDQRVGTWTPGFQGGPIAFCRSIDIAAVSTAFPFPFFLFGVGVPCPD